MKSCALFYLRTLLMGLSLFAIASCSSDPSAHRPEWVNQTARTVDGGYIVYVAQSIGVTKEQAQFRAEGLALEDMANECSFLPKGVRVEDRYSEAMDNGRQFVAVKVGLEFKDCDAAQKLEDPEKIREKASLALTEQLKRYQDIEENGTVIAAADEPPVTPAGEPSAAPPQGPGMDDQMHFYAVRQYIWYQKQVVILSPPGSYPSGSPALNSYNQSIATATPFISHYSEVHPEFMKTTQAPPITALRPVVARPTNLAPPPSAASVSRPVNLRANNPNYRRNGQGPPPPPGKWKRKHPPMHY